MSYNDANRLESITENSQVIAGYTYNAAGQRKTKVTPAGTTIYHYDLGGNLISETTSAGSAIKDYVWQGNEPIAQIDVASTEQITYLHTDHLMTARLGTNTGGAITWRWESDAFGQAAPEEDVDGNTVNTSVNLRFPGQYYDAETNLHYNWNRYYDPELGRYITSDPIGLGGGMNTYGYVDQNPVNYYDPNGLAKRNNNTTRANCESWDWDECKRRCGNRGVLSCGVYYTTRVKRIVLVTGTIIKRLHTDREVRCECGDDDDTPGMCSPTRRTDRSTDRTRRTERGRGNSSGGNNSSNSQDSSRSPFSTPIPIPRFPIPLF